MTPYVKQVLSALDALGIGGTVYDVYRSPADQEKRYKAGETGARAGQSAHQFGLAFDFVVSEGEESQRQLQVQQVWKYLGYGVLEKPITTVSGKAIYDRAHVEYPGWQLLAASAK